MHFEDGLLARIGHGATRDAIFAGAVGERLARSIFGSLSTPNEEIAVTITGVAFAVNLERELRFEFNGRLEQGRVVGEAILRGVDAVPIADAVIEGTLTLTAPAGLATIEPEPRTAVVLPTTEELTAAADGVAEADRERARRLAIGRKLLPVTLLDEDSVDELVKQWIKRVGFTDASHLVATLAPPAAVSLGLGIRFKPLMKDENAAAPRKVPFRAALLVRGAAGDRPWLMDALHEIRTLKRSLAAQQPLLTPISDGLEPRDPAPVVLCVPLETFEDKQWPGASPQSSIEDQKSQRAAAVAEWLVQEGVALVPVKALAG